MTMVVKNNIAAQLVLGELNKNQLKLGKSLEKVSSGEKFKRAKDNASGYVISEKMREQIRTLAQDNQNVQNGSSLFKIASGGVDNIVEELRNLKELAINAANDTNTDIDRKTIQKEFLQKMANINDIATMTNYNGKTLLDGTYKRPINEINEVEPIMIYDDGYNIDSDGIYVLARGFTGTVNVNAQNVKITQEDSTTVLKNVQILGRSDGNSNLWIEDLNIENNVDLSVIKFQGADNVLSVKGDNTLSIFKEDSVFIDWGSATINVGEGLTITGDSSSLNVSNHSADGPGLNDISNAKGAGIGGDLGETTAGNITIGGSVTISVATENGAGIGSAGSSCSAGSSGSSSSIGSSATADPLNYIGDISIGGNATITVEVLYHGSASAIGGAYNCVVGDITISGNANVTAITSNGATAAIGTGREGTVRDIIIGGNANVVATNETGAGIGSGMGIITMYVSSPARTESIIIGDNATVTATSGKHGAGIGSGSTAGSVSGTNSIVQDITIGDNANVTATGVHGAGIGSGAGGGHVETITIGSSATVNATSTGVPSGENIGRGSGNNSTVGTVNLNVANLSIPDVPDVYVPYVEEPGTTITTSEYNPLKIHHGTKANQATNFFIEDMHTKSLGTSNLIDSNGNFIKEEDEARYWALSYDWDKQDSWLETLKLSQNKTLDDISVTTKQNANIAIRVIDGAIDYALDESIRLGAYLQRLEYTDANVTTMGENVQAAESTIRDADMAKEMTEYTKANVLTQAAQSMLAQANQNSSAVLSLLQ